MNEPRQYVQLQLTCADGTEAAAIAQALLEERLIVCAKQLPVESASWWQGEIEQGSEVLLIMDSAADLCDEVEAKVLERHSYDTFVLQAFPMVKVSDKAMTWMTENLKSEATDD